VEKAYGGVPPLAVSVPLYKAPMDAGGRVALTVRLVDEPLVEVVLEAFGAEAPQALKKMLAPRIEPRAIRCEKRDPAPNFVRARSEKL
jgi:hypothetical protein